MLNRSVTSELVNVHTALELGGAAAITLYVIPVNAVSTGLTDLEIDAVSETVDQQ